MSSTRRAGILLGVAALAAVACPASADAREKQPPRLISARALDRDGDGRLDEVHVRYSRRLHSRTFAYGTPLRVRGYRIRRIVVRKMRVRVLLREQRVRDSGRRPIVVSRLGRRTLRAEDGARPVLVRARLTPAGALVTEWSEPMRRPRARRSAAFVVLGAAGQRIPVRVAARTRPTLLVLARIAGISPARVRYRGGRGAVGDVAGNDARPEPKAIPVAASGPTARETEAEMERPRYVLSNPIDPAQQTALEFGDRSHWLQPWRAYLDTLPTARLRQGIGINFNVPPDEAETYAGLLARAGFRHARVEIGWGTLRYDDPGRFLPSSEAHHRTLLTALQRHGIRPLILLNGHHGMPCPLRRFEGRAQGAAGSRTITLETSEPIVLGRTGLDSPTDYLAAEYLIVARDGAQVTLSKPLERDVDGTVSLSTLRYEPFDKPGTARFEESLQGWLAYAGAVSSLASSIVGPSGYDLEVWNEMTFGSNFIDIGEYYGNPTERSIDVQAPELTRRTVAWVRAHLPPGVGVTDGFASQIPWPSGERNQSGSLQPVGLTALSKHLYAGAKTYPGDANPNSEPLGALARFTGEKGSTGFCCFFEPSYTASFPEYYLTGLQTETAIRDLSPLPTTLFGHQRGRHTAPPGGTPPAIWMTETNMETGDWDTKAKIALRYYVAWIGKGLERLYLYGAHQSSGELAVVDPQQPAGGPVLRALSRLSGVLETAEPIRASRSLSVDEIGDSHNAFQFAGNGTPDYPTLYDREALFVQPFQLADNRFLVSVHVATRNALASYPPQRFSITLSGIKGQALEANATDPLTGGPVPVTVTARGPNSVRLWLPVGDSPRLITLVER